jgi:outer membrane protein
VIRNSTGRVLILSALLVAARTPGVRARQSPLTLRQAIAEALAASPVLRGPDDGRTLAAIRERQQSAAFGVKVTPTLQTGSDPSGFGQRTLGVGVAKRLPFGTDLQFTANSYQFGSGASALQDAGYTFAMSQPLLRGWTTATAGLQQARRDTVSAARTYTDARQRLVASVADAYFSVLRAERLVEAADRAHERAARLQVSSEARAKVGLATELDVLRADLLASQSDASRLGQREVLESAQDAFRTLIGRPSDSDVTLVETELLDDAAVVLDDPIETFLRTAQATRLEVREAHDRIGDARRAESIARWNLLPPISADLSYTKRGLGGGAQSFDQLFGGWRFGISSSYALNRSDESAAAATASVSTRAAVRDTEDVERRVADEVRRAHRTWTRTATTIDLQKRAVSLAERQVRLAQLRYDRGVADNFDVIDAENNLFQAQSGLIAAQVDRALAALTLRRVTGSLDPESFLK